MSSIQRNACLSCRQRKLKCDRQFPCANCVARSVECEQQQLPPASRGVKRSFEETSSTTISSILCRLDQIEAYIDATRKDANACHVSTPIGLQTNTVRPHVPDPLPATPALPQDRGTRSNSIGYGVQLVEFSAHDNILHQALAHDLSIGISTDYARHDSNYRQIQIPPQREVARLFQIYYEYIGQSQNIMYEPHIRKLITDVYYQVENVSTTTAPRGLALILSVIAMAIVLEPLHGSLDTVLPILRERLRISAVYIRSSMDCLEQHRRRMYHTLENVQAMLVLQFLIYHIEGFSPRYRALLTEAIAVSHSLGLHLIDSTRAKGRLAQDTTNMIDQEISRRVWWYLTATDWVISMAEAPFDVCLVQAKRPACNLPKHVNDDDLGNPAVKERPLTEPTTMSYSLQRLKVAEVARCISDAMPHDPKDATCEMILSLDSKLESLTQNLPPFFRLEISDSEGTQRIDRAYPIMPMQRLFVNMMINIIRCKLHFPYLAGNPNKSLHSFSREASLKAARRVLSTHQGMLAQDISRSADFMKIQGTVGHMFVGALILATDLCCNQDYSKDGAAQLSELTAALKQLHGIKQHSQTAAKFLDIVTQLLVKHGIWSTSSFSPADTEFELLPDMTSFDDSQIDALDPNISIDFTNLWETFVTQPSALDMFDI